MPFKNGFLVVPEGVSAPPPSEPLDSQINRLANYLLMEWADHPAWAADETCPDGKGAVDLVIAILRQVKDELATVDRSCPANITGELLGSEAVYGLLAWLTTRDQTVSFGGHNDCAVAVALADEFCKANGLQDPRENWHILLVHPLKKEIEPTRRLEVIDDPNRPRDVR